MREELKKEYVKCLGLGGTIPTQGDKPLLAKIILKKRIKGRKRIRSDRIRGKRSEETLTRVG